MIQLKHINPADAPKIAKWKSDPELSEMLMSHFQQTNSEEALEWIARNSSDPNQRLNGIYLDDNGASELVGITRLMFIDFESEIAEFGIYLGDTSFRGKGIGSEALRLTLRQGFETLSLSKIFLRVNENNTAAITLYTKTGFIREGLLKEHYLAHDRYENIIFMALFKEQFV